MRTLRTLISLAAAALAARASAIEVADGKLTVSGFGQWGYGRTGGDNAYAVGKKDGQYDNAQFSLAVTAQPQDEVLVAGQVFLAADGSVSLDWAFGEYRVSDLLRLRAGKVKNPFGIFMEVKDVGTLRPFFTLPQTIYGAGGFGAESYLGAGVTGELTSAGGWGLSYDGYVGALSVPTFDPQQALAGAGPPFDFSTLSADEMRLQDVVGGRVALSTPVAGLSFRLSGYTGRFRGDGRFDRMTCYGASAEWAIDRFQVRGEAFRATRGTAETDVAGYAEIAWTFLPKLQAALRYERAARDVEGIPTSSPFLRHQEGAVGVSYWASANLVFKASYHRVDGNRFAVPALSRADGSIDARTNLYVAGAQFAF